jgi:glycosyltransferase involved in cell wall biosynthesis
MSRYEGGAPTLVVSEALSSGCLVVCSEDSKQEVIDDEKNGLVIGEDYKKEAERVLKIFKDKQKLKNILINAQKLIKEKLTLEIWGKKYLDVLLN